MPIATIDKTDNVSPSTHISPTDPIASSTDNSSLNQYLETFSTMAISPTNPTPLTLLKSVQIAANDVLDLLDAARLEHEESAEAFLDFAKEQPDYQDFYQQNVHESEVGMGMTRTGVLVCAARCQNASRRTLDITEEEVMEFREFLADKLRIYFIAVKAHKIKRFTIPPYDYTDTVMVG